MTVKPTNVGGPFSLNFSVTSSYGNYSTVQNNLTVTAPLIVPVDKVLAGTTIDGQTGTMTNRGAVTIVPGVNNKTIPEGYHNGSGTVSGDTDLIASNIKSGVNIFGVTGTLSTQSKSKVLISSFDTSIDATNYWQIGYHSSSSPSLSIYSNEVSVIFRKSKYSQTAVSKTKYSFDSVNKIILYLDNDVSNVYLSLATTQSDNVESNVVRSWLMPSYYTRGVTALDTSGLTGDYYIKFGFIDQGSSGDAGYSCTLFDMILTN
ncbi:hypothetical protein [Desulfosporosinus shakirovi]|uniref:hypothetical protein n=1 Tax=Desulfosporosinus shakirovi TaxID=2885154 RepID=UPI001E3CBF57|nr:hypothetical protein [Desulfosporosinus sp. SRJS8]MCB8818337.1 hypothetical protein [Desulfosporosinus sp. SRJS8]